MKQAMFVSAHRQPFFERLWPFYRQYCEAHAIDLIVRQHIALPQITNDLPGTFERFFVRDLLQTYDRVAYLDSDIFIRPGAADLFAQVPADALGVYYESDLADRSKAMRRIRENFTPSLDLTRYFNSGVMVFSRAHAAMLDPVDLGTQMRPGRDSGQVDDQDYLNFVVARDGVSTFALGQRFNYLLKLLGTRGLREADFVHFAGFNWPGNNLAAKDREVARFLRAQGYVRRRWFFC